ncbi:hypothetical protein RDI58_027350 [Solanum bulbocastanum]|uniref:Uncharacterized protein n=1 Tax=Solanum bulbocastanum TaxID=147425 RepID=A0AAN8Y212_SOLBU
MMNEVQIGEAESSIRSEVSRRLSLSVTPPITSDPGRRSKVSIPSEVEGNGTVNTAHNYMNLTFVPPQFIDEKIVVQLEEEDVHLEEEKWRCALIAYVIGVCLGFNTMNIYITQNCQVWIN